MAPIRGAPQATPESFSHEIEDTDENHHIAHDYDNHPTSVTQFTVGDDDDSQD